MDRFKAPVTTAGRMIEAHAEAVRFYRGELLMRRNHWAKAHLQVRGLGQVLEPGSRWKVGYAPEAWSHLIEHMREKGFEDLELVESGLAVLTRNGYLIDRFRDRIMFAQHGIDLAPVGFIGRGRGSGHTKYLNTETTKVYRKSEVLVGVAEQALQLEQGAVPVVVEGSLDAIAVGLACTRDLRWAGISLSGTAISSVQARFLRTYASSDTVIVGLDGDRAGRTAAVRSLETLSTEFPHVLVADLPSGEDPASLLRLANGRGQLRSELTSTRPLVSLAIELELGRWKRVLDHLSGRVGALRAVAPLVRKMPAGLVANEVARLASILDLDAVTVTREVLELRERRRPLGFRTAAAAELEPQTPGL
ncbi:toprim domain-containing protein [Kribbella sp. NPDC051770]|uniref:toprim domain-containing protein n=1 Tax=Kribbella sp. NPDC051770 TaxID=3155413 RepID=UPI00343D2871